MAEKRKGARRKDRDGPDLPDTPVSDIQIRKTFGWSPATLPRKRRDAGFPAPDFYVDRRGYTWWSRIVAWTATNPKTSPIAGRMVGQDRDPADDFREAS